MAFHHRPVFRRRHPIRLASAGQPSRADRPEAPAYETPPHPLFPGEEPPFRHPGRIRAISEHKKHYRTLGWTKGGPGCRGLSPGPQWALVMGVVWGLGRNSISRRRKKLAELRARRVLNSGGEVRSENRVSLNRSSLPVRVRGRFPCRGICDSDLPGVDRGRARPIRSRSCSGTS